MIKPPFILTDRAKEHIKQLLLKHNLPNGYGLRVAMDGGGCGGMSYIIGFDVKSDMDKEFEDDDITIYMQSTHGMYLAGITIDYIKRNEEEGFTFSNPSSN